MGEVNFKHVVRTTHLLSFILVSTLMLISFNTDAQYTWSTPGTTGTTGVTATTNVPASTYTVTVSPTQGSSGLEGTGGYVVSSYDNITLGTSDTCFNGNSGIASPDLALSSTYDLKEDTWSDFAVKFRAHLVDPVKYQLTAVIYPQTVELNEATRSKLKTSISAYIDKNKLNDYQKVCLISCAIKKMSGANWNLT